MANTFGLFVQICSHIIVSIDCWSQFALTNHLNQIITRFIHRLLINRIFNALIFAPKKREMIFYSFHAVWLLTFFSCKYFFASQKAFSSTRWWKNVFFSILINSLNCNQTFSAALKMAAFCVCLKKSRFNFFLFAVTIELAEYKQLQNDNK